MYFYRLSGPMARHTMTSRSALRLVGTSQIFSLGSPTIGERSGARRSMELAPSCDPTHGCRPDLLSGRDDDDQCRRTSGKRGAALRTSTTTRPMAPTVTREEGKPRPAGAEEWVAGVAHSPDHPADGVEDGRRRGRDQVTSMRTGRRRMRPDRR